MVIFWHELPLQSETPKVTGNIASDLPNQFHRVQKAVHNPNLELYRTRFTKIKKQDLTNLIERSLPSLPSATPRTNCSHLLEAGDTKELPKRIGAHPST